MRSRCLVRARQPSFARVIRFLFAALTFLVPVGSMAAQSPDTAVLRPAASGVYSEDQAVQGKATFQMYCASCHSPTFHTDDAFRKGWFGRSVYELFRVLKTTMPEDNVGGLSDDEYARVIACILQINGFPAGKDSLPADSTVMSRVKIGAR